MPTIVANAIGFIPGVDPTGARGAWLFAHIALSFIGISAFATAAAAGCMYLVERRELKSRKFGAIFRFFPPLATLDRVNHIAAIVGWLVLTLGVVTGVSAPSTRRPPPAPQALIVRSVSSVRPAGRICRARIRRLPTRCIRLP